MTPHEPPPQRARPVLIASELLLIAEAVCAALATRGLPTALVAWTGSEAQEQAGEPSPRAEFGVLLSDLTNPRRITEARRVMQRHAVRWFVLTDTEEGAAWGAVIEAGAVAVLPSATPLVHLLDLLDDEPGSTDLAEPRRTDLVLEWRAVEAETERMLVRMHALSPRERSILRLLYGGESVRSIADRLEVSESTVRSQVRSVLRKLDVSSQLAAVAAFDALLAIEGAEDPGSERLPGPVQPSIAPRGT